MRWPTFRSLQQDARNVAIVALAGNAALSMAVLILAIWIVTRTDRVVLVPPFLQSKAVIEWTNADASYRKAWALYTVTLIGNITPGNARFVSDTLGTMLTPSIYSQVKQKILAVANDETIRSANGVSYFAPQDAQIEPETQKVFVPGYQTIASAGRQMTQRPVTYEVIIRMEEGRPVIVHLDSYEGMTPHTLKWLEINPPLPKPTDGRVS